MEDNFTKDEFEEFLQDQVRNHRMYPKDTVWRDINKKLHGDKKWPALTIAASALLSVTVMITVYFTPKPNIFALESPVKTVRNNFTTQQPNNVLSKLTSSNTFPTEKIDRSILPGDNLDRPVTASTEVITPADHSALNNKIHGDNIANTVRAEIKKTIVALSSTKKNRYVKALPENPPIIQLQDNRKIEESEDAVTTVTEEKIPERKRIAVETIPIAKEHNDKNMVDDFLKDHSSDLSLFTTSKAKTLKNKFGYQVYIAPSFSYRKLNEDRTLSKDNTAGPVGLNYVTDVNNVVRHKPGTGIEAGVNFMYYLSNKVRVKSGLQFNVRQYSIEAYHSNTEVASIALAGSNGFDTVNTYAVYRTNNGFNAAELVNRYYQLSVPLGIEWEIIGNKKIQLNVAGSIQPTYLMNRNAYLLTTNFKNYTENPDMVRRWNINSNIETFITFKAGQYKWQLGPQLRYQPYSTFIRRYFIKEHLLDYGIKLGVSKVFH
ncbi:MAG: hypothetical protein JWQ40_1749 [Segetibacter sp.]|nr:hypothetical protein [Segetibacter sp.]